jgi:hypothetical protein
MIDGNTAMNSHFENMSEQDMKSLQEYAFEDWLVRLKKDQNGYTLFKGKELDETILRSYFLEGKTTTEALNGLATAC